MRNWKPEIAYNDLPELPPMVDLNTTKIFKALIKARSALSGLNQASVQLPNPNILLGNLVMLESQASSEIENIVTTTDELFKANNTVMPDNISLELKETLNYRKALFSGYESMKDKVLSSNTAKLICSEIRGYDVGFRTMPGTYIGNPKLEKIFYTPPDNKNTIIKKLSNWENFMHNEIDLDPLVKMSILHYQFEAIHPFLDGNGRTGRILNILELVQFGLLKYPILYLSKYVIENKSKYYSLLNDVTKCGKWEEWVLFMIEAVEVASSITLHKITNIIELINSTKNRIDDIRLLELIFEKPYCRISDIELQCKLSRPTATKILNNLVKNNILVFEKSGRENIYINRRLMRILSSPLTR
jgi:Fic family protein